MNVSATSGLQVLPARLASLMLAMASAKWLALGVLLLFGLGLRLLNIGGAPLDFHAARQYRSFIIARGFYVDMAPGVPDWQRDVAHISQAKQGLLEPPLLEMIVAVGWRLIGSEAVWLPAVVSSVLWVIGGLFLYSIIRRIADPLAALLGLAFYLFLPFAVAASRSFQPDPAMVVALLAAAWAILRHDAVPSGRRMLLAAALASMAFIVQPRTVLVVGLIFLVLGYRRNGRDWRRWSRDLAVFVPAALFPFAAVYGWGVFTGAFRSDIAQAIVLPQLWFDPFFWRGWLFNIGASVGLIAFFGALLGTLLFVPGAPRRLLIGLWTGYVAFALVFNFAVATHDYYHLQLVPIVAIALAPLLALVVRGVLSARPEPLARVALGIVLAAALVVVLVDVRAKTTNLGWEQQVAAKEEIGKLVGHSTQTIYLSGDYGLPLEYHGFLAGSPWPLASDLQWERLAGREVPSAPDRFQSDYAAGQPEYFIVEDWAEFDQQPDLKRFLEDGFPLVASSDDYVIFDLRADRVAVGIGSE